MLSVAFLRSVEVIFFIGQMDTHQVNQRPVESSQLLCRGGGISGQCLWVVLVKVYLSSCEGKLMKILFSVNQMSMGGIEKWLIIVVQELRRQGHEPVVLSMSRSGLLFKQLEATGVCIRSITEKVKDLGFFKPKMVRAFRQVVKEESPDIVHLCDVISGHIGRIACIGLDVATVYHVRSLKQHGKRKYRLAGALLSYFTTCYFSVSAEAVEAVVVKENWAGKPYEVLHNCIDTVKLDSAIPANLRSLFSLEPSVGPILVTCGRLVKLKNIDLVIRALPDIQNCCPYSHLLILGDGPERNRLEGLVNELKLDKSVTFGEFRSDIPEILKALASENAIFLQPSEHEGLSNALSEALYCGLPAIISDQVPRAGRTEGAAVIVPCSASAIGEAVKSVFVDEKNFSAMQVAAKRNVSDLTPQKYVSNLLKLYPKK